MKKHDLSQVYLLIYQNIHPRRPVPLCVAFVLSDVNTVREPIPYSTDPCSMLLHRGLLHCGWCKERIAPLRASSLHAHNPGPRSSPYARYYKPTFSRDPWAGLQKQQQAAHGSATRKAVKRDKLKPYIDWYAEEMMSAVRQQAEFYLSPQNLSRDKYLQQALEQGQGWVPLTLICEFPRMAEKNAEPGMLLRALHSSSSVDISANQQLLRPKRRHEK
ncbi:hypothetical protein DUNSADRAFT_15455 [Dunaliella salina]|uniref:HTH La-type RNA-binding domain-containing protein n=1 Tax=Dunaliella salina TaxID=3046 RepID=A0ABQ7G5D8_DUNSA|nr:hypothetical protein DUNSADRAFT_15455 [Dunaliella salina]|eukprot:KAF5829814.1 hypothetical protein DUNSADRAFT_15455 [Dunaliella salina]